jgi:hypothetical protein
MAYGQKHVCGRKRICRPDAGAMNLRPYKADAQLFMNKADAQLFMNKAGAHHLLFACSI